MQGCRPLSDAEWRRIFNVLALSRLSRRNVALITLGIQTGFRISELLSVRLGDLIQGGQFVDRLVIQRRHLKRKRQSRSVYLTTNTKTTLDLWVAELRRQGYIRRDDYVFQSQRAGNRAITASKVWRIVHEAARTAGITGTVGTHSMRKTFAGKLYDRLRATRGADGLPVDALRTLAKALGHASIDTTDKYLSFREDTIDAAIVAEFENKGV